MNSKLLRSELKSIVKECLVEILSEGLFNQDTNKINENKSILSSPEPRKTKKIRKKKNKNINTRLTDDPIINEMLAETATSTLNEQILADSKNPVALTAMQGDTAAKIVDNTSPEDLFGDASDKWASLAFS